MMHAHVTASRLLASLTALDWMLLLILTWSTVLALFRGLIRELCSLLGLIAGVLLASWYYGAVARWLEQWISSTSAANVVAFLLIAAVVMGVAGLLGGLLRRTASTVGLGLFDRLAGGVFGFLRGGLIATVILMTILAFGPSFPAIRGSRLAPYFLDAAHGISFVVPPGLQAEIRGDVGTLKHISPDWIKGRQ